jgi:phage/plasmid primase-like uncharacterized protein
MAEPDFIAAFRSALAEHNLVPPEIIPDGQIHRFSTNGKRDQAGWYVLFDDGIPAGKFGDWRTGLSETWCSKKRSELTDEELAEQQRRWEVAQFLREEDRAKRHEEARTKALAIWNSATPAPLDHPYLSRKQVQPHGTRVDADGKLLVPIYHFSDSGGVVLWAVQEILGDGKFFHGGNKNFLTGSKKLGGFFPIGETGKDGQLYFCEGFATGASIHQATGIPVVVCFDAGNLDAVIQQWRDENPGREFLICGDNDLWTDGNPGKTKALVASKKYNARLVFPEFRNLDSRPTDFNDLHCSEGLQVVQRHLAGPGAETSSQANDGQDEKESHAQILIRLASHGEFFHDEDGLIYVRVAFNGHYECFPVQGTQFRLWLTNLFYRETGRSPSSEGFKGAKGVLEARGRFDGDERKTSVRVAAHVGNIYLDLTNDKWQAVEVTPDGWTVKKDHGVNFIRAQGMRPLPMPKESSDTKAAIKLLRKHINVDDDGFVLVVAWLLQALRPIGPYPVLAVTGEHGSAKSTFAALIRRLVDPNKSPLRSAPSKERDLAIACSNSWAVVFDNLSGLSGSLSDALCRVSTGGGFSTRMLYTNDEERLFNYMRPIILNGITTYIYRSDLADRTITVELEPIPEEKRKPESKVNAAFEKDVPAILGGLLDAVAVAMANIEFVSLPTLPRMADFALWVKAAEPALPWELDRFQQVFKENRTAIVETSLEGDLFSNAILEHFDTPGAAFAGTASELLTRLEKHVGEDALKKPDYKKYWPQSAKAAGRALKRMATFLRRFGFDYDYDMDSRPRTHIIRRAEKDEK